MFNAQLPELLSGDFRSLARCISAVENNVEGYEALLEQLPTDTGTRIIGITGPPGAGKSTLTDALITKLIEKNKKIAVLAVDPSSPFHHGALLGDRIRMSRHYNHPGVFIRSLATRGSLGGLHPKIIEISDLVCAAGFDYLLIETVGVGQSEVEIAALADTTIAIFVPESGDEIQTMKAGLMEIADIFVVNKSDHEQADEFVKNLRRIAKQNETAGWEIPVIKTIATRGKGVEELLEMAEAHLTNTISSKEKKSHLLAKKAFYLIQSKRMQDIKQDILQQEVKTALKKGTFSLYQFIKKFEI